MARMVRSLALQVLGLLAPVDVTGLSSLLTYGGPHGPQSEVMFALNHVEIGGAEARTPIWGTVFQNIACDPVKACQQGR